MISTRGRFQVMPIKSPESRSRFNVQSPVSIDIARRARFFPIFIVFLPVIYTRSPTILHAEETTQVFHSDLQSRSVSSRHDQHIGMGLRCFNAIDCITSRWRVKWRDLRGQFLLSEGSERRIGLQRS